MRPIITPKSLTEEEARKLVHTLEQFLTFQQPRIETQPDGAYARYLEQVRDWSKQFRPNDFTGRLARCSLAFPGSADLIET